MDKKGKKGRLTLDKFGMSMPHRQCNHPHFITVTWK